MTPLWAISPEYRLMEFEHEQERSRRDELYSLECPSCGKWDILMGDYICHECRKKEVNAGL